MTYDQAKKIKQFLISLLDDVAFALIPHGEAELFDAYAAIVETEGQATARALGVDAFHANDPFTKRLMTEYVGERIKQLDATTKAEVSDLIRSALDGAADSSVADFATVIADQIQSKFEDYADYRADRIARTETAIAYNHGTVLAAKQNGVTHVLVSDGDDDAECNAADGQEWELAYALANPTAHPNCTRAFSPIPPDDQGD